MPSKAGVDRALEWMLAVTSEFISGQPVAIFGMRPIVDQRLAEEVCRLDYESLGYHTLAAQFAKGVSKALQTDQIPPERGMG